MPCAVAATDSTDSPRLHRLIRTTVDNSGEHRPIVGELTATINAIVRDMPARCREVYQLRYTQGLDSHTTLELSVVTVKRHHTRALRLLVRGLAATEWADILRRIVDGTPYPVPEHTDDDA